MWVAMEATTLSSGPLLYFNRQRPLAGGDLEVPADRLGRHRAGPAGLVLPGLLRAPGGRRAVAAVRRPRPRRARLLAALAPRRLRAARSSGTAPRWGWPPCTPGSPTPTARRRGSWAPCWPGADELRLPRAPPGLSDLTAAGEAAFAGEILIVHRAPLDGGRRRVHGPPARLQAHAGLLQRRAHGHPGPRPRPRRRWPSSAPCCT